MKRLLTLVACLVVLAAVMDCQNQGRDKFKDLGKGFDEVSAKLGEISNDQGMKYLEDVKSRMRNELGFFVMDYSNLDPSWKEGVVVSNIFPFYTLASESGLQEGDMIIKAGGKSIRDCNDFIVAVSQASPGDTLIIRVLRSGKPTELRLPVGNVPVNLRKQIDPEILKALTSPDRTWLGVYILTMNKDLMEYFQTDRGALVMEVVDDSPAKKSGFKSGDVILQIQAEKINISKDVPDRVACFEPGTTIDLLVVRHGHRIKLSAKLETMPKPKYHFFAF